MLMWKEITFTTSHLHGAYPRRISFDRDIWYVNKIFKVCYDIGAEDEYS